MSDEAPARPGVEPRGRVIRWLLPVIGSPLLGVGGLWAVEFSQSTGTGVTPAFNPLSAGLYALMIVLYAAVSAVVRRWRQPMLPASRRHARAGYEALLVGLAGSPAVVFGVLMAACYSGRLCQ